VMLVLGLSLGS